MRVRLLGYVRHNGARYAPGSILSVSEREAQRLVRLGVAEQLPQIPPSPAASSLTGEAPKPPEPLVPADTGARPPATEGPEFIAALTDDEAVEALEFIQDATFIQRVIEIEQAKPEPRASVIEAAERRLAVLAGGE